MPLSKKSNPDSLLDIIYEDEDLMVINKPTGVVVNISETSPNGTIQNELLERIDINEVEPIDVDDEQIIREFTQRSGIVHRLDKDTSGVMLIAKTVFAFNMLKNQFKDREVEKVYMALVLGEFKELKVSVDAPIGRNPNNRLKMAVVDGGRGAQTTFELEKVVEVEGERFTLIRCYPKTGRTHQIRVHLAAMKYPIATDPLYMTKKQYDKYSPLFERLMLHAWKIRFKHPNKQKEQFFEAPLPHMMQEIYSKPY